MGSQVFYRKWRPQTLAEVVGQEQVTQTLVNALKSNRVSHAYLFCGPRGTGKTSTGRILAKAINCLTNGKGEPCNTCRICQAVTEGRALDVIEIDAASNTGVDNIRDLREKVNYAPNEARYKVYIIDEVHMLSNPASNALLKTLEEPPPHAIFILATTETHKVLPTIMSRCQRFDFRRISQTDIVNRLTKIGDAEGIHIPPEGLRLIARSATGSLRDAANLLEQLTTYYGANIELSQIKATLGITGDWRAKELVKNIVNNDVTAGIKTIHSVNSDGLDLKQFTREVTEHLRGLLLVKNNVSEGINFTAEDLAELKELSGKASLSQILKAVKIFSQIEIGLDNYSTLPLELAVVDCVPIAEEKKVTPALKVEAPPKPLKEMAPPITSPPPKPLAARPEMAPPPQPPAAKPEATPVTAAVKESSPTLAGADSDIEKLKQGWKQVLENAPAEIKKTTAVALLRSSGKPVALQGDRVTLVFRYPIHKDNMEKPENLKIAEKIISDFLGRPCRVGCVYQPEDNHLVQAAIKLGAQVTSVEEK